MSTSIAALAVTLSLVGQATPAQEPPRALFALVVGVNQSSDETLQPLAYADDDAARSFDLFRSLGAKVVLLADLDENTRRLHHQAAAEAQAPSAPAVAAAARAISAQIQRARQYDIPTTFYFIYAGHGNETEQGQGYLSLADARLTLDALRTEVLGTIGADRAHVIVDACHSDFLVRTRGPGGERRQVSDFSRAGGLAEDPDIGLLLASSKGQESHEWEAIQAGVFSHEVRSGLFGAADADTDGIVTYREMAAFVERANAAIPNERYRPRVFARPPRGTDALVDLRRGLERRVEVPGDKPAHYFLEDTLGVRLADFHNQADQEVRIIRPKAMDLMYLRRLADDREFALAPGQKVIRLADLSPSEPRSRERGAAHHAFKLLFYLPFGIAQVETYTPPASSIEIETTAHGSPERTDWLKTAGWTSVGMAGVALAAGAGLSFSALELRSRADADTPQKEIIGLNDKIADRNRLAVGFYCAAGATALAGLVMLLWPDSPVLLSTGAADGQSYAVLSGRF